MAGSAWSSRPRRSRRCGTARRSPTLRPGASDHEVLAAAEHAYVRRGGLHQIHYLGITAMSAPDVAVPGQWPTGRVVRPGDVVTCEVSAAAAPEYAGQLLRTFTVAEPPTGLY